MQLRKGTILKRILIPVMCILFIQVALYAIILLQGKFLNKINKNEGDILKEQVENKKIYLENSMVHQWINMDEEQHKIADTIDLVLRSQNADVADIKNNARLNTMIIDSVYDEIRFLLRRNLVTGAFLILDGPAIEKEEGGSTRAGLYIRDLDPTNYMSGDSDILMERGIPSISKKYKIPLDSFWSAGFQFSETEDLAEEQFFFNPYNAANNSNNKISSHFGYFSPMFQLNELDINIITYSLPLFANDGTLIGVLGIDITENHLMSFLSPSELDENDHGLYFLSITRDHGKTFEKVCSNGSAYKHYFDNATTLTASGNHDNNLLTFKSKDTVSKQKEPVLGYAKQIKLYNSNTPFADEQWYLIGMMREDYLFAFSKQAQRSIFQTSMFTLLLGFGAAALISRRIARPVSKLTEELKRSGSNQILSLPQVHIYEIDELIGLIRSLSQEVVDSSFKMSRILSTANISLGVFEYKKDQEKIFCSSTLSKMFHWGDLAADYEYMDNSTFVENMNLLLPYLEDKENLIYHFTDPKECWFHLTILEQANDAVIGIFEDITSQTLEKQKMEYERDFDPLTDLFNRRAFQEKVTHILDHSDHSLTAAMIMWDLDNLKYVNDTYGHEAGDQYIIRFANALHKVDEYHGISSRRSGDEFLVFLYGYSSKEEIRSIIEIIDSELKQAILKIDDNNVLKVRASAGIAWYPDDSRDYDDLVRYSDYAMYHVKHSTKGNIMEFNMDSYDKNAFLLNGSEALNRFLDNKIVQYALQPIIEIQTGNIYGYELLMRPQIDNFRSPLEVLEIAKAQSKLYQIEYMSWFLGLRTFASFVKTGAISPTQKVFVNSIASHILSDKDRNLFESEFSPYLSQIVLEITENEPLKLDYTNRKIDWIKEWGGMLAIDDFGAGYNNEATLLYISPNIVKVDMDIIRGIDSDLNRQTILNNLLTYTKNRSILILAEGVETKQEMDYLKGCNVDLVQGYYVGKPSFSPVMHNPH